MTLDPLPSILCNPTAILKLFPFPICEALIVLTPVALTIVNVADPVSLLVSLWLNERVLGLIVETHCGIGVESGFGLGVGDGVGVGEACGFPFPLFPLSPLFPFPSGVAVGLGVGLGPGSTGSVSSPPPGSSIGGVASTIGVGVGVGSESTSPVT